MSIAIKMEKYDADLNAQGEINFERHEIMQTITEPNLDTNIIYSQKGKPTLFIISDDYTLINITVRVHGTETESKLIQLKNFIQSGGFVRVYPKYFQDPAIWFDCIVDPKSIPASVNFAGESMAGKTVILNMIEYTQENQYVIEDDEITIE
jgi:hypothetical protein